MTYNLINQQGIQLTEEEIFEALKIHRMAAGNSGKISITMYDGKTKRFFRITQQCVEDKDIYIKEMKI